MIQKTISFGIIIVAAAIVIVNVWNTYFDKPVSESPETVTTAEKLEEDKSIPGADLSEVKEGELAPDFTLATIDGKSVSLSDYKGQKVILNFWATWCPPCKAEMPHMQKFYEENKDNGIEIVAVNLTNMDEGKPAIEQFVQDYELTFPVPLDEEGDIGMQYQAFTIPTSYVIDTEGKIAKKIIGPMDENMMKSLIDAVN
ncbi:redoxin domain-containing protein [Rossellomorea vietnamensis]|uniref:Redoxin domain-containing protein n=1 Tax=Rossellomorea vietnamensis TaxID=218284 RepID=A0A5D4MI20_9BACI|nr:redoxin domain-containing protein [Rossellomorea vietnamensis]TYS01217.1 redoxin domain-containing protein [Rossellomorea vietnamensis]